MSLLPLDGPPGALPASAPDPAPAPDPTAGPARSPALARLLPKALSLLPLLLIGAWAVFDWHTVYDGAARLAAADPWWLLAAVFFTCLGWVATACVRQGALPDRLPPGLLLASQFAAGAANHVLPASMGAHAVTLRFLLGRGIPLPRAAASLALYVLVRPIAKTLVLLVFLAASPDLLRLDRLAPDERTLLLGAGAVTLGLAAPALVAAAVPPLRRPALTFVRTALTDARLLHTRPARVLALWGGAAATPLLQASVIASVGAALGLPLSWAQVTLAFLAAGAVAGAVPAPGGIGPVDAALVFTMAALGAPLSLATATVIGYRVVTIWLPLIPGALVLSALVHRKVL
ncbi:lysylphosphatidylglycerol synthase transmembrane domain-containing protein [Streptomyces sp. A30]|uniref:lysylphosphatidylglycerol synthase transmembrane domain-containing protein n=1 Tax=Streptomyces sp. A30 TaxID=2789273 RepID=UPI00397F81A7